MEPTKLSEGNEENVHPAHPTRQASLNQLHLVYLKTRWGARYVQQLWYLRTQTLLTPPILDGVNQIRRHKPSTPKHAKQTSHLSEWTCEKVLKICGILCNHWCLFLWPRMHVLYSFHYTFGTLLSSSKLFLILVCIVKKQTTSLHRPVLLWPFSAISLSPQGNVCLPAAWAWTVSLQMKCCAKK